MVLPLSPAGRQHRREGARRVVGPVARRHAPRHDAGDPLPQPQAGRPLTAPQRHQDPHQVGGPDLVDEKIPESRERMALQQPSDVAGVLLSPVGRLDLEIERRGFPEGRGIGGDGCPGIASQSRRPRMLEGDLSSLLERSEPRRSHADLDPLSLDDASPDPSGLAGGGDSDHEAVSVVPLEGLAGGSDGVDLSLGEWHGGMVAETLVSHSLTVSPNPASTAVRCHSLPSPLITLRKLSKVPVFTGVFRHDSTLSRALRTSWDIARDRLTPLHSLGFGVG